MASEKIIYLVQGGLNAADTLNLDLDFFIITFDFKKNYGYIGKKGKKRWKLYTILGRSPMVLGSPDNHYHFSSFEACVSHLEKISDLKCEIKYIDNNEDENTDDISEITKIANSYLYRSEQTVLDLVTSKDWALTAGADYKLELYLEYINTVPSIKFSDTVVNGSTFHIITERHNERIKKLEEQLEVERKIIRPEDIPDFDFT